MGAAVAYAGFSSLNGGSILTKILLPLVLSPLAGFGMGLLVMFLIMFLCAKCARNKLNTAFTRLQVLSAAFMATSHGMNDAQKTMGVITLALFIFNEIETIAVPLWVKCLCAAFMALGTAMGGWKIVKTMGLRSSNWNPFTASPAKRRPRWSSPARRSLVRRSARRTRSRPASSA